MRITMKRVLALFFVGSFALLAGAQTIGPVPPTPQGVLGYTPAKVYNPQDPIYGACTWTSAGDVGPCINAAITACGTASPSGGAIPIPAGLFGVKTAIVNNYSGCSLYGAGVGNPRDSITNTRFLAVTTLQWTGAAHATLYDQEPTSSIVPSLYATNVTGITFDCNNLADVCAKFSMVVFSTINVGVSEPVITGFWATTNASADCGGFWNNDVWVFSRSTSNSNTPVGILFDSGPGSSCNSSVNHIHTLFAWATLGDGIVFGNSDSNTIDSVFVYSAGATNGYTQGRSVVFASSAYTMSNGNVVNGLAYSNYLFNAGRQVSLQGFQSGSSITSSGNSCNGGGNAACGPTSVSLTTNSTTGIGGTVLNYASTGSVVAAGMAINCTGGENSGVAPNSVVKSLNATTVTMINPTVGAVASSLACNYTYGITTSAVPGTYTLTSTGTGGPFTLTAPGGGHTQSGIAVAFGSLIFTDMVIPWTGTASNNDAWTIVVPSPSINNIVDMVDKTNNVPTPYCEIGAVGDWSGSGYNSQATAPPVYRTHCTNLLAIPGTVIGNGTASNAGTGAFSFGYGIPSASGSYSWAFGPGVVASGFNSIAWGQNLGISGANTAGFGNGQALSGSYSFGYGLFGNDRGRQNGAIQGGGEFNASGDAQIGTFVLRGTGAAATAFRLTGNAAVAAAANCISIPNNSAYALTIDVVALDHTTVSKNMSYNQYFGLLTRGANAASTAVVMETLVTPLTNGVVTGATLSATADTTIGCLNLSFTPPTGNTDTWNAVARVQTVEVQ